MLTQKRSQAGNSVHPQETPITGHHSRVKDLDLQGHFLCDDVLMQFITEEFCSCIPNEVQGKNFSNNNSSSTVIFHPRQDRGIATTLIRDKENVSAIGIFSLHHECTNSNAGEHGEQINVPSRSYSRSSLSRR